MDREAPGEGSAVRGVGLLSGGLDGFLAAALLARQGVRLRLLFVDTGFNRPDRRAAIENLRAGRANVGVVSPPEILDARREYFETVVLRPKHGYGSAMNPCIDCRIFLLEKAAAAAARWPADLVFTGEVLGQSRMAERRDVLLRIEEASRLAGRLLRPLSAAYLAPTEAEARGRIDRAGLGALHGRGRSAQRELAAELGLDVRGLPSPGGGCCLLSDPSFARRLRDRVEHAGGAAPDRDEVERLRTGRHFRLAHDAKAIVARDEAESRRLLDLAGERFSLQAADGHGAVVIVEGEPGEESLEAAARLAAWYGRSRAMPEAEVRCRRPGSDLRIRVAPRRPAEDPL